jgi:hypothetical protein
MLVKTMNMLLANSPSLNREMNMAVLWHILIVSLAFWIPGAAIGSVLAAMGGGKLGGLKRTYACNAVSLCILSSIPAGVIDIPAEPSWKYALLKYTLLIFGVIFGSLSANSMAENMDWRAWRPAFVNLAFAILLFMLPLAWTARQSYVVFNSSVKVPAATAQSCLLDRPYKFVHLSDLHIVANGNKTRDDSLSGNAVLPVILEQIRQLHPQFIFITGDMTDGGETGEWKMVSTSLKPLAKTSLIIMSPGNHDLNLVFDLQKQVDNHLSSEAERVRRFLVVQSELNSNLKTFDHGSVASIVAQAPPEPVESEYQRDVSKLTDCYWRCAPMGGSEYDKVQAAGCRAYCATESNDYPSFKAITALNVYWKSVAQNSFPLIETEGAAAVIVLGTVFKAPAIVGQNALGILEPDQYKRFDQALRSISPETKEIFILAHHPFTRPEDEQLVIPRTLNLDEWKNSKLFAYSLLRYDSTQAREVVNLLNRTAAKFPNSKVFVLFGHRHMRSFAQQNNISFLESPNLGTTKDEWKGFFAKQETETSPCWHP